MAKKAQRSVNARRARNEPLPELPIWHPPSAGVRSRTIPTEPDLTNRIVQRIDTLNKRIVDFAVIHLTINSAGEWEENYKIDCDHGNVHRHPPGRKPEIIRRITSQEDVIEAFKPAYDEVYDAYTAFKEQQ